MNLSICLHFYPYKFISGQWFSNSQHDPKAHQSLMNWIVWMESSSLSTPSGGLWQSRTRSPCDGHSPFRGSHTWHESAHSIFMVSNWRHCLREAEPKWRMRWEQASVAWKLEIWLRRMHRAATRTFPRNLFLKTLTHSNPPHIPSESRPQFIRSCRSTCPDPSWPQSVGIYVMRLQFFAHLLVSSGESTPSHSSFIAFVFFLVTTRGHFVLCFVFFLFFSCAVFSFPRWGWKTFLWIPGTFRKYLIFPF